MLYYLRKLFGLPLVYGGVAVLALSYATGLSHVKAILIAGLALIVAGTVGYVAGIKRRQRY